MSLIVGRTPFVQELAGAMCRDGVSVDYSRFERLLDVSGTGSDRRSGRTQVESRRSRRTNRTLTQEYDYAIYDADDSEGL